MTNDLGELFQALFEASSFGMLVADDDANYVEANRAACALLGRQRDTIVGSHLSDVVEGARREEVKAQWQAFLRDGVQAGLFPILLPDGSRRMVSFQAMAHIVPGRHVSFLEAAPVVIPSDDGQPPPDVLVMCAWTKRVQQGTDWIPLEKYLAQAHGVLVSHGISPQAVSILRL